MISTLIIEDEERSRTAICALVSKYCPELNIIETAASAEEGYKKIEELKPQLVLTDIRMPGHSGFQMLKRFKQINFEVIFITAFDRYAVHAFEFSAIDYIIKPLSVERLKGAVSRAVERIRLKTQSDLVMHFVQSLSETDEVINKFSLHHNGKVIFIQVSEVSSIESVGDATILWLNNGVHYPSSKRIHDFENLLEETHDFIRISKSAVVNTKHIKSYSKGDQCFIELTNGQTFEVSRRRKNDIIKKLKELYN